MVTDGSGTFVPQPTATSGMAVARPPSAATAVVSGAITMIPSTAWPMNRSTASSNDLRSNPGRLQIATE